MTIGSLYIKPLGVLLMFVPFVLAFIAVWLRSARMTKDTAGYVSNASRFGYWLFVLTVLSIIITTVAGFFDSHLSFFSNNGLWFLVVLALLFFLCYYVIAFKPVTDEQLEEERDKGSVLFETAGLATAGVAGGLAGTITWTLKMLARAPIEIVRQSGNTIWYRDAGIGGTLGGGASVLIVLLIAAVIIAFLAMYFLLFIVVISWLLVVYKFVKNLMYLNGPRK